MNLWSWLIVIIPMLAIFGMAIYSRRYVRDVTDYLACGRVAGRYVMSVGDLAAGLSVITLVAMCEQNYQTGLAISFWGGLVTPIGLFMALSGYCLYRFRQTRCLSCGQFLEMRYSRRFRIVACTIRTLAEAVTNAIGPAVAVRFFIYFLGLKPHITMLGFSVPTYSFLVAFLLACAMLLLWPAGRISLLLTDCLQGIFCYPIFVIFTVFVLMNMSWFQDVAPVMLDRPHGESFLNPMDISALRDFNLFALFVSIFGSILNRAAWIGNDTSSAGRTPHEQKMAGILGTWRNGFSYTMLTLVAIFVITFMLGNRFADKSHEVRLQLVGSISQDLVEKPETREKIKNAVANLPVAKHEIGVDQPYSREHNPDTPFFENVHQVLLQDSPDKGTANATFQQFKTLYGQMMMPVMLKSLFPPVLMGLFTLLMMMLLLSTDDARIFNASSTIVQDIVLPLKKNPMSVEEHLKYLKGCSLCIAIFFFIVSIFFAQMDYINMFTSIMCSVWLGAAGPIMVGGLYTRFGTTAGAWASLVVGSGIPMAGIFCQRKWADIVYPWLERNNLVDSVGNFMTTVSKPFDPYIVWKMNAVKFPINSVEIGFMAMVLGLIAYVVVSKLTLKEPFNLDRMLHRGIYSDNKTPEVKERWTVRLVIQRIVGIDHEYTKGDKMIAWSVVVWSLIYTFGIMFCGVLVWNIISPWPAKYWAVYFFITVVAASLIVGSVSTVWFLVGGIRDMLAMFRDLAARVANPLDDGRVEGHVSAVDIARFKEIEKQQQQQKNAGTTSENPQK